MSSKPPLITTIIPTYRRPERLKKAIQSVLSQTYPHFQLRIYDNASDDSTADIVRGFAKSDSRIAYHCHKKNIGAAENFQYGLTEVTSSFFSFLSDDDFLLPEFYETTLKGFEKFPDAGISSGAVIEIKDDGTIIDIPLLAWQDKEYFAPSEALFEMIHRYSNWTGSLIRSEVVKQIGPLDISIKPIDVDFLLRIAARFPVVISKKPSAVFVSHEHSYSANSGLKLLWPSWPKMIANLKNDDQIPLETKAVAEVLLQNRLQKLLFNTSLMYVVREQFSEALAAAKLFYEESNNRNMKGILRISIYLFTKHRFFHSAFMMLYKIKRLLKKRKTSHLQVEYGSFVTSHIAGVQ